MRSHRRRYRRVDDGAESGNNDGIRDGMAGSDIRPSCVAVSKCSGRVIVAFRDDDGATTIVKSSCVSSVALSPRFLIGGVEEEEEDSVERAGLRWSYSSRRRKAETIVCFARSTSVNPGLGPTTNDGGSVLTRTFPAVVPPPTPPPPPREIRCDACCRCVHGKKGRRSDRRWTPAAVDGGT